MAENDSRMSCGFSRKASAMILLSSGASECVASSKLCSNSLSCSAWWLSSSRMPSCCFHCCSRLSQCSVVHCCSIRSYKEHIPPLSTWWMCVCAHTYEHVHVGGEVAANPSPNAFGSCVLRVCMHLCMHAYNAVPPYAFSNLEKQSSQSRGEKCILSSS